MSAQSTLDKIRIADAILRLVLDASDLTHSQKYGAIRIARDALADAKQDAERLARDSAARSWPRTVTPPPAAHPATNAPAPSEAP